MIFPLIRRSTRQTTISSLYGTIVAQARLPCFYREYEVPDTVNGRFELVVMHLALVLNRLEDGAAGRELGQALFDHFCSDMDHNLREMGIGDLSVPKQMRRVGEAFYGRARAYQDGLRDPAGPLLAPAIRRNIYETGDADRPPADRLAAYMREAARILATQALADLLAGRVILPNPADAVFVEGQASPAEG
ncbi:MAG TPA: ubiquinol-cytochrome C chaperone family protein [Pseudolabrys sp.]|nr:ubiquinol-cytochrome C chaperone family protein [Pseudolabrys sp.]